MEALNSEISGLRELVEGGSLRTGPSCTSGNKPLCVGSAGKVSLGHVHIVRTRLGWRTGRGGWGTGRWLGTCPSCLASLQSPLSLSVLLGSTLCPVGSLSITAPTPPSSLMITSTTPQGCGRTASARCRPTTGSARPGPWRISGTPSGTEAALPSSCASGRSLLALGGRMAPSGSLQKDGGRSCFCPRPGSQAFPGAAVVVQSLSHVRLFGDPMDCSTPGSSVIHYLPAFAQIHVHRVDDAI